MFNDYYKKFKPLEKHEPSKKRMDKAKAAAFARIGEGSEFGITRGGSDLTLLANAEPQIVRAEKHSPLKTIVPIAAAAVTALAVPVGANLAKRLNGASEAASAYSENISADNVNSVSGEADVIKEFPEVVIPPRIKMEDFPENVLEINSLTKSEIVDMVNANPNFRASDAMYVSVPEKAPVYIYNTIDVPTKKFAEDEVREEFKNVFEYFFPEREIDENRLKCTLSYRTGEQEYRHEVKLINDIDDFSNVLYLDYDDTADGSPVKLFMCAEFGRGLGRLDRGEAAELAKKADNSLLLKEYDPITASKMSTGIVPFGYFPQVGEEYPPDSTASFRLLDGETRICDAVKCFEEYVNNIPLPQEFQRNTLTKVYGVRVLRISDDEYGYYFDTQPEFQGISADYDANSLEGNDSTRGWGFMLRSNDIDIIDGMFLSQYVTEISSADNIIPLETALKTVSGELTQAAELEIDEIRFVYYNHFARTHDGYIDITRYEGTCRPAWVIYAHDPNNGLTHYCYYLDAENGKFMYSSSPDRC